MKCTNLFFLFRRRPNAELASRILIGAAVAGAICVTASRWQFITVQAFGQLSLFKEAVLITSHFVGPLCKLAISAAPLCERLLCT